ncbi:MAG: hypothetical protein IT522_16435 [Burkholderiales bacterium]|nr:hypothetical protein [Burkholderiales bacterium]
MRKGRRTWLIWVVAIAIVVFVAVDYFTGYEVIGAATRVVWNAIAFVVNSLWRASGELAAAVARAVGMRRAARVASALAGVGLGYAGSVILSEDKIHRAHTWRDRLRVVITRARNAWVELHLVWKLVIVAALIASQVYLHFLLIVFPVAFLVPVVRRAWIVAGDTLFGSLYRKKMTRVHRAVRRALWRTPGYPQIVGGLRLLRMRYLCAWRRWRYDASYRDAASGAREVSLVEPVRLWWRGELDRYREHPLLTGDVGSSPGDRGWRPPAKARDVAPVRRTRRHGARTGETRRT